MKNLNEFFLHRFGIIHNDYKNIIWNSRRLWKLHINDGIFQEKNKLSLQELDMGRVIKSRTIYRCEPGHFSKEEFLKSYRKFFKC